MTRRSRRGYYVDGEFLPGGSAADQQFRSELRGGAAPSRTALKEASKSLQALGEELLTLRADLLASLALPETLQDAILEAKRLSNFEGLRRQKQYIGRLMHRLDAEALDAVSAALRVQRSQSAEEARCLHQVEKWREALIADDAQLQAWLAAYPGTDSRQLRMLIRQARKEASGQVAGGKARQGRAYRELFKVIRLTLTGTRRPGATAGPPVST